MRNNEHILQSFGPNSSKNFESHPPYADYPMCAFLNAHNAAHHGCACRMCIMDVHRDRFSHFEISVLPERRLSPVPSKRKRASDAFLIATYSI